MAKKKEGGICAPGGMCYQFPGPGCSICCMVFSLFGVVGLLIISGLLKNGYKKAEGEDALTPHSEEVAYKGAYVGVAIYGGFIGLCFILFIIRRFTNKKVEDDDL